MRQEAVDRAVRVLSTDYGAARAIHALHRGEENDVAFAGALLMAVVLREAAGMRKR